MPGFIASDTSEFGNLMGNSIGNSGGFGLTGTGQGGGGAGNVSGLGGLGTIAPGSIGYGSGKKKETTKASANKSKNNEQKAQETNEGTRNTKANQTSINTSLASANSTDQTKIKRLDAFNDAPTRLTTEINPDIVSETKKAGIHPKEMPVGNYVAVESFVDEGQANRFAARLVNLGFDPNVPLYVSANNRWYVCLEGPIKFSRIQERISHYRTMEIFKSAWQLTIK